LFDYDGDGKPDLFLVNSMANGTSRLLRNLGAGKFTDVTLAVGMDLKGSGHGCAAGDFDNDGHADLAVCLSDGVRLLRNDGDGKFMDVTEKVGIRREKGCVGLTFVDYDHDGDLDLYVTMTPGAGAHNILWRNNGNSTFTDISEQTALGVAATGAGVVTTDFNNDRAIDFVVAGGAAGAAIYLNPREGKFAALPGVDFAKENLPTAVGVVALDFDRMAGWIWCLRMEERRGSVYGATWKGSGWSACDCRILAGNAGGELRRWITTMMDGSILWPRGKRTVAEKFVCCEIWGARAGGT
jgi:hypothetical protein